MTSQIKPIVSNSKLINHTSKSRHVFIQEYKHFEETKKRKLCCEISREMEIFIGQGNLEQCKKLTKLMEYIRETEDKTLLEDFQNDDNNPLRNTNLVILACKHNQVNILNHILELEKNNDIISPNDTDEANHNGFYYAIRSSNTKLLDVLVDRWPGNYFADNPQALDDILSQAYEELKLKNVPLSEEMEFVVESKLINLRFFSDSKKKHKTGPVNLKTIIERIELVIENIHLLKKEYIDSDKVDEKFLFMATFIAQNIHILKRQLKSTYDRLPWEEIEFCLVCYISSHKKQEEINFFYRATIKQPKLLLYLDHFARTLEYEMKNITKMSRKNCVLSDLPLIERERVIEKIKENTPQFKDLYNDYHSLRDMHSLQKISDYIKLALSANPNEKEGQLIITRVLQVIGEYFKNTLESPKMSVTTSELLLLSLPKNTRKIVVDLRNSLSHAFALSKRTEIQENTNSDFFRGIQNDTKKIGDGIICILFDFKLRTIRMLLNKIMNSKTIDDITNVIEVFCTAELDVEIPVTFIPSDYEKLMLLISKLKSCLTEVSEYETELFKKMESILKTCSETMLSNTESRMNFRKGFIYLKSLFIVNKDFRQEDLTHSFESIKLYAKTILDAFSLKIESSQLKDIISITKAILNSVRSKGESFITEEIMKLTFEICYLAGPENNDLKLISDLRNMLRSRKSTEKSLANSETTSIIKPSNHLDKKLTILNEVMTNNGLAGNENKNIPTYRKNKQLQAAVEMLVLDIMSILSISKNNLEDDSFFLDSSAPMLTGKPLRNHLAHDNNLVDILCANPTMAIVLNAQKLTSENLSKANRKVGNLVNNDPSKLKEKYNLSMGSIVNQEKLFRAFEAGKTEEVINLITAGADINARNSITGWTALHFAAKGPSLSCVKLALELNSDLSVKDKNGQTPLHIAAANGRTEYIPILSKDTISFDNQDFLGRTALHMAAKNGQKDVVVALLNKGANTRIQDLARRTAIFYAVVSKHAEVAKILWEKDSDAAVEQTSGYSVLHAAAEVGLKDFVELLIEKKSNINVKTPENYTPLHKASAFNQKDIVQLLLSHGADIHIRTISGISPLHMAAENGHEEVVNCLIRFGADVNAKDRINQYVPLHAAAMGGFEGIVEILLNNKADVNATNIKGETPLHCAAGKGHVAVVRLLIQRGASIYTKNKYGATPLDSAVYSGNSSIVKLFFSGKEDHNSMTNLNELLNIAVFQEHEDLVKLLISKGANVNHRMTDGISPLYSACVKGNKKIIHLLIKNDADIDSRTDFNLTPLHAAALNGHIDAVEMLLNNDASVHAISRWGGTPLHCAVIGGSKNVAELLLQKNAHVDALGNIGITPLLLAIRAGNKEMARLLRENGADLMVQKNMMSPLLMAVTNNDKNMVETLLTNNTENNNYDVNTVETLLTNINVREYEKSAELCLLGAIRMENREILEILLKAFKGLFHINKKLVDPAAFTLLHFATHCGYKSIVKALLSKGASVNSEAALGTTALCIAASLGHTEIAEILIEHGANVNIKGDSPLHLAASNGHEKMVELLLTKKARINAKDYKNRTALQLAVANGHLNVVKRLFKDKHLIVDINSRDDQDFTLLHIACDSCHAEVIKFLVDEGADINVRNRLGSKPIHFAAREGCKSGVEFFVNKGMDVNEPGMLNQTPLHYAAGLGQSKVLEYLLASGANVNAKDTQGTTPLHVATNLGHIDCVKVLLKYGADYTASNEMNLKPLDITEDLKILNVLISTEKLFQAVKSNNCSDVEKFIEDGAFVNAKRGNSGTVLHFAAWKGYDKIVRVLLHRKADPNATSKNKMTPLHYAAKFSHYEVVKTLLTNGAVYESLSDISGKSPSDFSTNKEISDLFDLIKDSFDLVKRSDDRVIQKLKSIDNIETIKAVMCARNRQNETLVVTAIHQKFPNIDKLKSIHQGDIAFQLTMNEICFKNGDFKKALDAYRKMYEQRKKVLGPDNPGTLDIRKLICRALYAIGSQNEALEILKDVFKKQFESLGMDNPDTLDTRGFIALLLHRIQKNEEALPILEEVYQKQVIILGLEHQDTLNTQIHMGLVLNSLGKYDEALKINKVVYEKWTTKFGENSSGAISALNNIAMVLSSQGKHEEALKIYDDVLKKKKRVYGEDHLITIRTMDNMATILFKQQNFKGALEKYEELLKVKQRILGSNHPDTIDLLLNMGNLYFQQGKWINALKIYKDVYDKAQNLYGKNNSILLHISKQLEFINNNEAFMFSHGTDTWNLIQKLRKDLNIAAQNGDVQTVESLLKHGADINDKDEHGRTPLHFAVSSGKETVVRFLLKNEADVIQFTNKGNTPLHTATNHSNAKLLSMLLDHIDPNKLNKFINSKTTASGTTALHIAAKNNAIDIVRCLLKRGAAYNIRNNGGKKPVNLATEPRLVHIFELIEEVFNQTRNGNVEMIHKLGKIESETFIAITNTRCDVEDKTLVQVAMSRGHRTLVKILLELINKSC